MAKKVQSRVALSVMERIRCTQVCTVDGLGTHIAVGTEFPVTPELAKALVNGGHFEYVTITADAVGE